MPPMVEPLAGEAQATEAVRERRLARWDLDKTYLRTDFDTLRDLVRTAIERPDQKRTVPGAAALLRELGRAGVETHILSGSPEQLRGRIVEKLKLDGVKYASLTLKPNLQNLLRLRFRALKGQLGYKLPALLLRRCEIDAQRDRRFGLVREILLGDDAEADAFVYCLFADVCRGAVDEATLREVMARGGAYADSIEEAARFARYIDKGNVVTRILIHLDRQSSPADFSVFGGLVVPFYNYLQAALVLFEDGWLSAEAVLAVATDLVVVHNFERRALSRSYLDLHRRGHLVGAGLGELRRALAELVSGRRAAAASELMGMLEEVEALPSRPRPAPPANPEPAQAIDYLGLVLHHNPRRSRKRR